MVLLIIARMDVRFEHQTKDGPCHLPDPCFTEAVEAASGCVKQRGQQQDLKAVTGMGCGPRLERADFREDLSFCTHHC